MNKHFVMIGTILLCLFMVLNGFVLLPEEQVSTIHLKKNSENQLPNEKHKLKNIRGVVLDENGEPLVGANIKVKNASHGVLSDHNGEFTLQVSETDVIIVSFVGYVSRNVLVGNKTIFKILLKENTQLINEVVVTGYQTISKERATGAFDIISQNAIDKPTMNISQRLLGQVPGLVANQSSDGDVVSFTIRGQGGLISNAKPLLVVDGFPVDGGFSAINPNDVETISILKDAATASIWGARASNGVVVITTKKGANKKMKIEFSANFKVGSTVDLDYMRDCVSSSEMIEYEKSIFGKYGIKEIPSVTTFDNFKTISRYTYTQAGILRNQFVTGEITEQAMNEGFKKLSMLNNNRQIKDLFYQRPFQQQYNLALSGGSDRMDNYISLLYNDSKPSVKYNKSQNIKLNYRTNIKAFKWLDINLSSSVIYSKSISRNGFSLGSLQPYDMLLNEDGSYTNLSHHMFYTPIIDKMVPKEKFPYPNWNYNPVEDMRTMKSTSESVLGRFQAGLTFKLMEGLSLETRMQYERSLSNSRTLYDETSFNVRNTVNTSCNWNNKDNEISQNLPSGQFLSQSKATSESYDIRNQLSFNRTIAKRHAINAIAGIELIQKVNNGYYYPTSYGYDDEHLTVGIFPNGVKNLKNWIGAEITFDYINSFSYHIDRYFSAYGNASYTFDNKYSVSLSARTDASNFITDDPSYRYSPFWSVGLSWNAMNEQFMQKYNWIDYLKLRSTYGCNGNSDSSTSVIPLISINGYNQLSGDLEASIRSKGNPTLRWERTYVFNLGTDFSFFDGRLYGKIDYYNKQGRDILGRVSIPILNGEVSAVFNNASIDNQGIELMLGSKMNVVKDLVWNGSITLSYNKNKVTRLFTTSMPYWWLSGEGASSLFVEGKPIGQVYSYAYAGVKNVGSEVSPRYMPCVKLNGDNVMSFDGSTTLSGFDFLKYQGTTIPPYSLGMSHSFSYKNFDLSFIFTGKFGHIFRKTGFNYPGKHSNPNRRLSEVLNGDPQKIVPMPAQDTENLSVWDLSHYMDYLTTSANHIRMQELILSYNLPLKVLKNLSMSRATLYLQGNNLLTIKSSDEDPEFRYGGYPMQPYYTFGIKCAF